LNYGGNELVETTFFSHSETARALNSLGDNIFVCDLDLRIVWFNDQAEILLHSIISYLHINHPLDLIGKSIDEFHQNPLHQRNILLHRLPYESTITLFDRFAASIVISEYKDDAGVKIGYLLVWRDVTERQKELQENKKLVHELSTVIIPTVIDNAILIPLIGTMNEERTERLVQRTLNYCVTNNTDYVLLDFSGLSELDNSSAQVLCETMTKSLALMGVFVVYVGITKQVVQWLMNLNLDPTIPTFATFRQGINHVVNLEGYSLVYEKR